MKKAKRITAAIMSAGIMFSAMPAMASATPYYPDMQKALEECGEGAVVVNVEYPFTYKDAATYFVLDKNGNMARFSELETIISVKFRNGYTADDVELPEGTSIKYEDYSNYPDAAIKQLEKLREDGIDLSPGYYVHYKYFDDHKAALAAVKASPAIEQINTVTVIEKYKAPDVLNIAVKTKMSAEDFIALYPELGLTVSDTASNGYSYVLDLADAISPRMKEPGKAYEAMVRLAASGTEYKFNVGVATWESDTAIDTFGHSETCTPGDANCNGTVDVADVVAVLQYMTNSTKYPLSEQGIINADIDGEEGITGGDASAIQRLDAGIWDES